MIICSGHGAIGSALALGARGCQFESGCPDQSVFIVQGVVMLAKRYLLLVLVTLTSPVLFAITLDTAPYQEHAQQWIKTYIQSDNQKLLINAQDLEYIANLLYFSFLRSAATVETQEIAYKTLQTVWQGWQNIAQTRLNPSQPLAYTPHFELQEKLFREFTKAQYKHRIIGLTYSQCAHTVIKEKLLSTQAHSAAVKIRKDARTVVAQAFLDVKKIIGPLYEYATTALDSKDLYNASRFDVLETIATYIPYFALQSFVEAEQINTKASEQTWNVISTIVTVSKQIWDTVETARAAYYLAHYYALVTIIKEHNLPMPFELFNEHGIIQSEKQKQFLSELRQ